MKRIQAPDGSILEFPPEMDDDAILGVMRKEYGGPSASSVPMDMAKSLGAGVVEGTADIAGQPRDIASLVLNKGVDASRFLANKARGFMGLDPVPEITQEQRATLNAPLSIMTPLGGGQDIRKTVQDNVTGPLPESQTTQGKYARTVGQFLPGALLAPAEGPMGAAKVAGNLVKYGVIPGLTSEAAGQATEGTAAEPYARVAGALVGSQVGDIAKRVVTPNPINPERARLVNVLSKEGVDVTAGQKTGARGLQYLESASGQVFGGGGKAADITMKQGEQFTQAALKRAGITADRATTRVIDDAFKRIGNEFDTLAGQTTIKTDAKLGVDLFDGLNDYLNKTSDVTRKGFVQKLVNDIGAKAKSGSIDGEWYKTQRSAIDRTMRGTADPEFKGALIDIKNALDDAVERSISPDLVDRWRKVRTEYRNILPIEDVVAGPGGREGILSPQSLRQSVVRLQGKRNYARGQGDFADLVQAGDDVMLPLPDSGTAGRSQAFNMLNGFGLAGGGGAGFLLGGGSAGGAVAGALAGQAAAATVPAVAARTLMSKPVQSYLGNQMVTAPADPARTRLIQAIMAAEAARREPAQ
jgi:hypothetical protein